MAACIASVPGAFAETRATVFTDDFSSGLGNWTPGTKAGVNDHHEVIVNAEEEVEFIQEYDYIEKTLSFEDSFEVSFEVRRTLGSSGNFDFLVELVQAPAFSGLLRLQYGSDTTYKINIGVAPSTWDGSLPGADVDDDTGFLKSMPIGSGPLVGTVTYTYANGAMKFGFTHDTLGTIETPWVETGASFTSTAIRIWAMGTPTDGGTRFVDNVLVDAPVAVDEGLLVDAQGNLYLGEGQSGVPVHVLGNMSCTGVLIEGSSRALKRDISSLTRDEARDALDGLQPVKYTYKADPTLDQHAGFIAEDVPALLATPDRKGLSAMDIVAILTRVVQDQQKEIDDLKRMLGQAPARPSI
jgi:hypothetical protein